LIPDKPPTFKLMRIHSLIPLVLVATLHADEDIDWLVVYDGKSLPTSPWTAVGEPNATLGEEGLHLDDDGAGFGHYRAEWQPDGDQEIVVEAVIRLGGTTGVRTGTSTLWPWRDGAPVMVQVSDGRHQDGLVLFSNQATNFTDRFIPMATTGRFHTYRLVIRGTDMEMWVDGERRVEGKGAFQKPADNPGEAFVQFGSSAATATGDATWQSVRLGVRKPSEPLPESPLEITLGESWDIPREVRQTRPYLYDMGEGLLLMSVAQGPDAFYEPYGLLKSTDGGNTWTPIPGLDQEETTPLPCLRRPDGSILAMSRWTWTQPDGRVTGKTVVLDSEANSFEMFDNEIRLPQEYTNETEGDHIVCERHIWNDDDGGVTMVVWSRKGVKSESGRRVTTRHSHLMRSTDEGRTWDYFGTIGPGGEPAVVRLGGGEMTAVIRGEADFRMRQTFSHDGGKTWTPPAVLEVGRVLPDLVLMSNGVLACSYGRPSSCLMFSLDGGKTWPYHQVVSYLTGFNYTSIREVSPGRLLYIHDAPKVNALHVDVKRVR
jgi:hypothetical protein